MSQIKHIILSIYFKISIIKSKILGKLFGKQCHNPIYIPIIINNYNRLSYLKRLINSLESRGYFNIYIIDNNSTYPPLIEYYKSCPYKVFMLNKNVGYKALWETDIYKTFRNSYYVYTDSDVEIIPECPSDFMEHFVKIMDRYPLAQKVGFGICINDLPDYFANKTEVITHESKFWKNEVEPEIYKAQIDTTFALYRPFCSGPAYAYHLTLRTGGHYMIRHLPWYVDSSNLNEEERFYINSTTQSTHWTQKSKSLSK